MKFSELPKEKMSHLVRPAGWSLEDWQVALRMQQAQREAMDIECVSERYNPGEYRVRSRQTSSTYKVVFRGPKSPWNYCDCMDFKTSQLGTCKHIEGVRLWITSHHKRIHWDLPSYTSVYLNYRGEERRVRIRIGSDAKPEFTRMVARYFDDLGFLRPEAFELFGEFLREAKLLDESFRCYKDALDFVLESRERITRRRIVTESYNDVAIDGLLRTPLYPYQREGVRFAAKAGRAILADEMGLGKTIQAIATAELLRREHFVGQVLILCPATLLYQWRREIERFTQDSTVAIVEGTAQQRAAILEGDAAYKIASYSSIAQDIKGGLDIVADMLVLDEVQRLKNWNTQQARAVRRIHSRYALILSGTPLENRLEDLYSIVELVDQFLLSPYYQFRDRYLLQDETGRTVGYQHLNEIAQQLGDIMLRRRKADVALQLPQRIDKNLYVPMTPQQTDAHHELRQHAARLVAKWHRQHFLSEMDRKQLLLTLNQMRMVCDSLYILDERSRHDTKVEETMNILDECGILAQSPGAPKVVIFSQWERMTRLVAQELDRSNIDYAFIHGSVPARERQQRTDEFQTNPAIRVFLSTDAGATGINLQAASVIINLDMPWNPAVLEQRIGRIHRIGQERGVEVINLIAANTIEEDMLSRLRFKSSLFDGVLDGGEDAVFLATDKFDSLLSSLHDYIAEPSDQTETSLAIYGAPSTSVEPTQPELPFAPLVEAQAALDGSPVELPSPAGPPFPATASSLAASSSPVAASSLAAAPPSAVVRDGLPSCPSPAAVPSPAAAALFRDLAVLLRADEATRLRVAAILDNLTSANPQT